MYLIIVINFFVLQLNSKVTEIANSLGIDEQNDDLVGLLRICNPFSGPPNYSYIPSSCSDAIPVGKLPEVSRFTYWHKYVRKLTIFKKRFNKQTCAGTS